MAWSFLDKFRKKPDIRDPLMETEAAALPDATDSRLKKKPSKRTLLLGLGALLAVGFAAGERGVETLLAGAGASPSSVAATPPLKTGGGANVPHAGEVRPSETAAGPLQKTGRSAGEQPAAASLRSPYMPASDILSGKPVAIQEQKQSNELTKAMVEDRQLQLELAKLNAEIQLAPMLVQEKKREIQANAARRSPQAVEKRPAIPPQLLTVHRAQGKLMASMNLSTGESVMVREGERAGEFTVLQVMQDRVLLRGPEGQTVTAAMKLPDRYPVSPSLFKGQGGSSIAATSPQGHQAMSPGLPPIGPGFGQMR